QNRREMSAEFVREQCCLNTKGEIPFGIAVEIREFREGSLVKVVADVWVKKENHKKIVIGKDAQMLKKIGTAARKKIEKYVGQKVFLELQVVSNPQWDLKKSQMKAVGLK
ncbi:MAG: KH domain-containing protein, partial [Bdellovibrio sp.]